MKLKLLLGWLIAFLICSGYLFLIIYDEAKNNAIAELNARQMLHAKQAQKVIESFIDHTVHLLENLSLSSHVVNMDDQGKKDLDFTVKVHPFGIKAITRTNASGRIIFLSPHDSSFINKDLSAQKHIKKILKTHQPVASDVFYSVNGYPTIAIHVPVFKENKFDGTVAMLIDFLYISKYFLQDIRLGKTGYAWMTSREGIELYCPIQEHIGKSVFENCKEFPTIIDMAREMVKGKEGVTTYMYDRILDKKLEIVKKHAVYKPIKIVDGFWTIIVASSEGEVLASLVNFKNKLIILFIFLFIGISVLSYYGMRSWGIFKEVIKRQKAERKLFESERRYRALFEGSRDGYVVVSPEGRILEANQAYCNLLGYSVEELQQKDNFYTVTPERWWEWEREEIWNNRLMKNGFSGIYEKEYIRKDGTIFPVELQAYTVVGENGKILYLWGIAHDITDRKNAEKEQSLNYQRTQALLQLGQMSESELKDITDFALEKAVELTQSKIGYLAFLNEDETILTMHSWSKSAMEDCAIADKPLHYPVVNTGLWGEAVRQRRVIITNDYPADNSWKKGLPNGHVRILRHMNLPIFENNKIVIVAGVGNKEEEYKESDVHQITLLMQGMWRLIEKKRTKEEQEKLKAQLVQAQKMESIGRLAGGVAHDFNNMLSVIIGRAELTMMKLQKSDLVYTALQDIETVAKRSAALIRQLLAFARKQTIAPKPIDLNDIIENMLKMLQNLIGENITLLWKPGSDLWMVKMDPTQIDQIMANIVVNARDAIHDTGKVTIETTNADLDEHFCNTHSGFSQGQFVVLTVSDTGDGMDNETLSNIFEPFFTTKPIGMGTGLGLATVYGIVRQNNGAINVCSKPGQGTTFQLYFPRHMGKQEAIETLSRQTVGGSETVLLVEDDVSILDVTETTLKNLGYNLLIASKPEEAINHVKSYDSEIHLMITDVIMPEMNGLELSKRLQALHPSMKLLFMSGYPADVIAHHGVLEESVQFIQKPFMIKDFAAKIREVLDFGKTVTNH